MARQHGGDLYDFANMTDDEIRSVVVEHLREYPNIDAGWIEVTVEDGFVTLKGRVGTDSEQQVAESVIADVLGIQTFANELVVTEIHRGEAPVAADEAVVEAEDADSQIGGGMLQQSDTADHLVEHEEEEAYGTHDMQSAIRDGTTYTPPDHPVGDGYDSRENH